MFSRHSKILRVSQKKKIKVIDELIVLNNLYKCNDYIKKLIIDNSLFLSGHYQMDRSISVRDWIDLEGLFSININEFINPVTECIYNSIDFVKEKCNILGINYYGGILASILGYKYDIPFTYYFDNKSIVDISEKDILKNENKKLIIIVDVVVFGYTLCSVVDELIDIGIITEESEINVIVLFERKINDNFISDIYLNSNIKKIFVLNDDFDIEVCNKNKRSCMFRNNENINQYKEIIT